MNTNKNKPAKVFDDKGYRAAAPQENYSLIDAQGRPIGRTAKRGEPINKSEFFPVVHVWIRDQSNEFLIQLRSTAAASSRGIWACTGGYICAGENPRDAALREVREELGLDISRLPLRQITVITTDDRHETILLADVKRENIGTPVIGTEVACFRWASYHEIRRMVELGEFVPYSYLDLLKP